MQSHHPSPCWARTRQTRRRIPIAAKQFFGRQDNIRSFASGHGVEPGRAIVAPWTPADRLWELASVAVQRVALGELGDLSTLQPYYLRMPSIGTPKQRDRVVQGKPAAARP